MENETSEQTLVDDEGINKLMPSMNVSMAPTKPEEKKDISAIVSDEKLLGMYDNIIKDVKKDTDQIDDLLAHFSNMVLNDGDATTSSKEALVKLVELKVNQSDKITKIADLMTRIKLKQPDTFPKYLAANQKNEIHINGDTDVKRALIEELNKAKGKK